MADTVPTLKVKPWGKDQGEFVEINADDFDAKVHTLADPLDHDGDGEAGGSLPGKASTVAKGRAKKVK